MQVRFFKLSFSKSSFFKKKVPSGCKYVYKTCSLNIYIENVEDLKPRLLYTVHTFVKAKKGTKCIIKMALTKKAKKGQQNHLRLPVKPCLRSLI